MVQRWLKCFDRDEDVSDFRRLLLAFQSIRKQRCEKISKAALANADVWHMPDSPEQEKRDANMRQKAEEALKVQSRLNVNKFNDKD